MNPTLSWTSPEWTIVTARELRGDGARSSGNRDWHRRPWCRIEFARPGRNTDVPVIDESRPANPGYRRNLEALKAAQKPSRGTAAYSRLVNRPAGRVVAAAAHTRGLSPDGATAISATMSALG